jgi:heavy metal translocating P-type ATPase
MSFMSKNFLSDLTLHRSPPTFLEQTEEVVHQTTTWLKRKLRAKRRPAFITQFKEDKTHPTRLDKVIHWLKTGETDLSSNCKISKRKTETHNYFLSSTGALLCSTVGAFGFYPFYILGGLSMIYLSIPLFLKTIKDLSRGDINVETLYTVVMGGLAITGNFWVGNLTMLLYAVAEKITLLATDTTHKELIDVFKVHPDFVWVISDGVEVQCRFEDIHVGDIVAVHAGEMIPADGTVVEGIATIDQHILTGESQPVEKEFGQPVFATTMVLSGKISVKVEKAGNDSIVAKIGRILNETTDFKSSVQMRSQILSDRTVLPTLIFGAISLPLLGFEGALAVVSAHFKCKMNATAPLSALNHFKSASKQGILFKDGRSLDLLYGIDTIVFDKTGTLTQDEPTVTHIHCFVPDYTPQTVLCYAASAEVKQTHPIARAILRFARQQDVNVIPLDHATYKVGYGLQVVLDQHIVRVGSTRFMELEQLPISACIQQEIERCHQLAHSLILVAVDKMIVGGLELATTLRPEVHQVIAQLRRLPQIQSMYIISGDNEIPTRHLAQELGIDQYFAETLPQHKATLIEQLQREGKSICFIGDGINDSIALRKAQVSVSLRGASTIATDSAQIVLMDGTLEQLPALFTIAKHFHQNINLMFGVTVAPMIFGIASVFLFQFGLVPILIINKFGLIVALWVAMQPTWKPLPQSTMQLPTTDVEKA